MRRLVPLCDRGARPARPRGSPAVGRPNVCGAGLAFAHKYNEDGGIFLAYFGDGAATQGQVYEAFNMAALWNLPICFVVEDNQYAMGTATKRSSAETRFYRRGTSFRIPGMEVDGMNVLEVRQAAEVAFKHIREGNGPVLMECNTYRYRGHSMSDPAKYRTREEVQKVREEKDAIEQFGFLMNAFEYGAPPHGGIAFGFDRLCAIIGGQEGIRDFIAFPKNNSGRDIMINSPSNINDDQLKELKIK